MIEYTVTVTLTLNLKRTLTTVYRRLTPGGRHDRHPWLRYCACDHKHAAIASHIPSRGKKRPQLSASHQSGSVM